MVKTIAKLDELLDWVIKAVFWVIKTTKREKKRQKFTSLLGISSLEASVVGSGLVFSSPFHNQHILALDCNVGRKSLHKKKQGRIHGYRSRVQVGRGHI